MSLLERITRRRPAGATPKPRQTPGSDTVPQPAAVIPLRPGAAPAAPAAVQASPVNRINLLPWREARRQQQQRDFMTLLAGVALLTVGGVVVAHMQIAGRIENQEARNGYLRQQIAKLEATAKRIKEMDEIKARLLGRLETIQNLQRSRPGVVRMLDELVRLVPQDIYLTSLKSEGATVTLTGIASSNNVMAGFMRNLDGSASFRDPVLKIIETKPVNEIRANTFELTVSRIQKTPAGEGSP